MARFRNKPIEIEAVQWFPGTDVAGVMRYATVTPIISDEPFTLGEPTEWRYYVTTIHLQHVYLEPGDWIITEPDGIHHYPCKPDIFETRYVAA